MWARVIDGSVSELIAHPKNIVDQNGVQHPRSIFTLWSKEEKLSVGIYEVINSSSSFDSKYYISHDPTYEVVDDVVIETIEKAADYNLEDIHAKDEEGTKMLNHLGKPMINKGLKSKAIEQVKNQQASMLQQTDWAIIRKADNGTEIPANIQTYRDAIRVKAEEMETAIIEAKDMKKFISLNLNKHNKDGSLKTVAALQDWPQLGE